MSELETALLIVLVIILVIIAWRWYVHSLTKLSDNSIIRSMELLVEPTNSNNKAGHGALNPNTSLVASAGERDGYGSYTPGSDEYDSYVDANESFDSRRGLHRHDSLSVYAEQDEMARAGLNAGVVQSHNEYIKGLKGRSTSHSMQSLTDHPNDVNPWAGLRGPRYHIAKSEPGARVVSSSHYTQHHPGTELRWSSSATDYSVCP